MTTRDRIGLNFLAFFAIVGMFVLAPHCARGENLPNETQVSPEQHEKLCVSVGNNNFRMCITAAYPDFQKKTVTEDFVANVCSGSAQWAYETCKAGDVAIEKYQKLNVCVAAAQYSFDAIVHGSNSAITSVEKKNKVDFATRALDWATTVSTRIYAFCRGEEAKKGTTLRTDPNKGPVDI